MGTRADFYIGRGVDAEWIGSIAWDGHPENFLHIRRAKTEAEFRRRVEAEFSDRDDATRPAEGWPWPWSNSSTTDYAYAFDGGHVYFTDYPDDSGGAKQMWYLRSGGKQHGWCTFPDMSAKKNVTFGKRSGILLFR